MNECADGAWVVIGFDLRDYPLALFDDELSARRWCDLYAEDAHVYWWPWGAFKGATRYPDDATTPTEASHG